MKNAFFKESTSFFFVKKFNKQFTVALSHEEWLIPVPNNEEDVHIICLHRKETRNIFDLILR